MRNTYIAVGIMSFIVLAALVFGFFSAGSPWAVRGYKLDSTRLSAFSSIQSAASEYYYSKMALPQDLATLTSSTVGYYLTGATLKDPDTQKDYDYKIVDANDYQLCTTFFADSKDEQQYDQSYLYEGATNTSHAKGYDCLSYTVGVKQTPPYPPTTYYPESGTSSSTNTIDISN